MAPVKRSDFHNWRASNSHEKKNKSKTNKISYIGFPDQIWVSFLTNWRPWKTETIKKKTLCPWDLAWITCTTKPSLASLAWSYLLDSLLVFHSFPFEFLTRLPGVSKLSFIQITAASGCWQVLLQLPDGHLHLLQLCMILLSSDIRTLIMRGKHKLYRVRDLLAEEEEWER